MYLNRLSAQGRVAGAEDRSFLYCVDCDLMKGIRGAGRVFDEYSRKLSELWREAGMRRGSTAGVINHV
jgi:hypothetical protein